MRMFSRVLIVAGLVAAFLVPGVATAQEGNSAPVTLNITKVVTGGVPEGTVFEVQIDCDVSLSSADGGTEGGPTTQTIEFDEAGGTQSVSVPQFQPNCTITETGDGGAESVSHEAGEPSDALCEFDAAADSIAVSYGRAAECSVTIVNTFTDLVAPPVLPPDIDPADVIQSQPAFTG